MTAVLEEATSSPPPDAPSPGRAPAGPDRPPRVARPEAIFLIVGTLLLAGSVIGTRWGVFTPDTRPDLYQNPAAFLRSTVQGWVGGSSGLGQGNFNAGAGPVAAVVWVIRSLGASPWLAVRIWRLLVLLIGAWGIRRYLGTLMGRRLSVQARILATVFWVVNPYVIVAGSTTPILLPYALLPWTLLAFIRATRSPHSWRWPALFGLGFFAQTGLNAGVVPFFQLLALPAHIAHARWIEGRSWRDLWRVVWRSGICSVAVSLYWLLPSFLASSTGAGIAGATENPVDVARTSSYAETSRLLGNWPLYGRSGARRFLGDYTVYLTSLPVLIATFLVPIGVGLAMWRARARERLLVAVLLFTALPVMVGLFPTEDPYPAGRLLATIFDRVPASLAFRTTNKVGAVVVLAETIALAFGWRAWQQRTRSRGRRVRWPAVAAVALLLVGISAPLWNGGLYPLGYKIPAEWQQATADLEAVNPDQRVLVVPGGTGGNYRWGMRSPDDVFASLLDRPVAVRNTVVGRGDAAGNFLSAFDLGVAQGALPDGAISTAARYLGASDVLVRNDLLVEEIGGAAPWVVVQQAAADPGLVPIETYGVEGRYTIPGSDGASTRAERRDDRRDAALPPIMTFSVTDPIDIVTAAPAADQVLTVGDGDAFLAMSREGIIDGTQPVRYVGDLDGDSFADAVAQGGRVVLTDTNRRRAWDINRVANATSPTLTAEQDIDDGNGSTITLWPDSPRDQTVSEIPGQISVGADRPGFGLTPYGRASNAFDDDPNTAWLTGGFNTAEGASVWIEFPQSRQIDEITILPYAGEPSSITAVRVQVGDKQVIEAIDKDEGAVTVAIESSVADRVEVTILSQSAGNNPVGISEISVDDVVVRNMTRVPRTLNDLAEDADDETREALASLPLDVLFTRAQGSAIDGSDDEESQLDRLFTLPDARLFTFRAELSVIGADPDAVAAARLGSDECTKVAVLDGKWVEARITSTPDEIAAGDPLQLEGCGPIFLPSGEHELVTVFGWRLNSMRLASEGSAPGSAAAGPAASAVEITDRTATRVAMEVAATDAGDRYLRLGEAYDQRWSLTIDGEDAGPPILVDGYSTGWLIDGDAHELVAEFGPQAAVEVTFVASALALVGVTAMALVPAPVVLRRRRHRREAGPPEPDGETT